VEKVAQNAGYIYKFKKTAQSMQSPNGRKFAQSGHPDRNAFAVVGSHKKTHLK
jgi:hypothetical protein